MGAWAVPSLVGFGIRCLSDQNGPELLEQLVPAALGLALAVGIVIVDDLLVRCAVFRSGCITYPNP